MDKKLTQSGLPKDIPLSVLLDLSEPAGMDWGRIRALQFQGLQQHGLFKLVGAIVCGIVIVQIGFGIVNSMLLGSWFVALCGLYLYSHFAQSRQSVWMRKSIGRKDTISVHLLSLATGSLWGAALILFGMTGDEPAMIGIWSVIICLTVGSGMLLSAIPLEQSAVYRYLWSRSRCRLVHAGQYAVGRGIP